MIYTIFDVETTGLKVGTDCVLQFAYLRYDTDRMEVVDADSFYLWEDSYPWSEEAYAVHKIEKSFLRSLPKEEMKVKYGKMFQALSDACLMTYNGDHFDIPFCDNFLKRYAVQPFQPARSLDIMKVAKNAMGKRFKLVDLVPALGIDPEVIKMIQSVYFGTRTNPHDATYDVIATYLCYIKLEEAGCIV